MRSNGPRSLFCFRPAEIIHYSDSKISKRYFRAETLRAFSRNKTKVVERTTLESLILCRNSWLCFGRKHSKVHPKTKQTILAKKGGKSSLCQKQKSAKIQGSKPVKQSLFFFMDILTKKRLLSLHQSKNYLLDL